VSDSRDDGRHWSDALPIGVDNPNAAIDALVLHDGRTVLVYDDSLVARTPLVVAVSADGLHFRRFTTLESAPGEYSYPALIQDRNGVLDITYTWRRERIRFARIRMADVAPGTRADRPNEQRSALLAGRAAIEESVK
jgi:predicted neuraminidase